MSGYKGREDSLIESACWCDRDTVLVRPQDVRDGLTRSCGRAGCRKPRTEGQ
jgi:hypothetical protein